MGGYGEDELLPLSALQHLAFCERQCALIHLEQVWEENSLTVLGRHFHEQAHGGKAEIRQGIRTARGLRVCSLRLGLAGVTDVVEFHRTDGEGCKLPGRRGRWRPFPVEYKRGRPKSQHWDRIQLCAQALCLEEMLDVAISSGALFYGETRRREDVSLDECLREAVEALAARLHNLLSSGSTPSPPPDAKCRSCSLRGPCAPEISRRRGSAQAWIDEQLLEAAGEEQ